MTADFSPTVAEEILEVRKTTMNDPTADAFTKVGIAVSDGIIDTRIDELRTQIAQLEARIKDLEAMKGTPGSGGYETPTEL